MATTKKAVKKVKTKVPRPQGKILFLHVRAETKTWLRALCKKQIGKTSQSTMAERIFHAVKASPEVMKALNA